MLFRKNLLLFFSILFLSSSFWFYTKAEQSKKNLHNIASVNALQSFILSTQKTRGLTNSYRHGNVSALLLVYNEREQIAKSIHAMDQISKTDNFNSKITHEQEALSKKIQQINSIAFKEEPIKVFKTYTSLINDSIALSNEHEEAIISTNPDYQSVSHLYFPLIEAIAKLRGLGSGSAAKQICSEDEAIQLTAFIQIIHDLQVKIPLTPETKPFLTAVKSYTTLAKQQIIQKGPLSIDPDLYFDQGTAVITAITSYTDALQKHQNALALKTHQNALYTTWVLFLFTIITFVLYLRTQKNVL